MQEKNWTDQLVTSLKTDTKTALRFCSRHITSAVESALQSYLLVITCQDEIKLLFMNMVPRIFTRGTMFIPKEFLSFKSLIFKLCF